MDKVESDPSALFSSLMFSPTGSMHLVSRFSVATVTLIERASMGDHSSPRCPKAHRPVRLAGKPSLGFWQVLNLPIVISISRCPPHSDSRTQAFQCPC